MCEPAREAAAQPRHGHVRVACNSCHDQLRQTVFSEPPHDCADAARYHGIYGVYRISVFAVRGVTVDEIAQQVPLVRFDHLSLLTVKDVLAAGIRLEPTGRNPRHYTVGFDDLEDGVRRLASCPHQVMPNSYHDA